MKGFDIGKVPFKENYKERNLRESFIPAVKDGLQWSGRANVQSPAPPQTIHVDLKISSEQTKYGSQRLFKVKINRTAQNAVTNILIFLSSLRAESARAFTGRQNSYSGRGKTF